MKHIKQVEVCGPYQVRLTFGDGVCGTVDLSALVGKGVFSLWTDRAAFEGVRIGNSGGLVWGDQVDLCPDALYLKVTGKSPEDLFPALGRRPAPA